MNKTILGMLVLIIIPTGLFAQSQLWNIFTFSGQPYNNVVLSKLVHDTLLVKSYGSILPIPVDSIRSLKREKKSYTGLGIIAGMIVGGIAGNQISITSSDKSGIAGGLAESNRVLFGTGSGILGGGFFGYILAKGLGSDEKYSLKKQNKQEKIALLTNLISRKSHR